MFNTILHGVLEQVNGGSDHYVGISDHWADEVLQLYNGGVPV